MSPLKFSKSKYGYAFCIGVHGGEAEIIIIASAGQSGHTRYTIQVAGVDMTMNCAPTTPWGDKFPPPITGQIATADFVEHVTKFVAKWVENENQEKYIRREIHKWFHSED